MIIKHENVESESGGLLVERVLLSVCQRVRSATTKSVCNMGVATASVTILYNCDCESSLDEMICKIEFKTTLLQLSPLQ